MIDRARRRARAAAGTPRARRCRAASGRGRPGRRGCVAHGAQRGLAVGRLDHVVAVRRAGRRPPPHARSGRRRPPAPGPRQTLSRRALAPDRTSVATTTPTATRPASTQPARRCRRGRAASGCRARARTGRAPAPPAASTEPSTTSADRDRRRAPAPGSHAGAGRARRARPAARGRSVVQHAHPPASQTAASEPAARSWRLSSSHTPYAPRATPTAPSPGARPSRQHLEPARPTWSAARRAGRARSAGTGSRGRAPAPRRRAPSASRVRVVVGEVRRAGSIVPNGAGLLQRRARARRCRAGRADQVEQVPQPDAGPGAAGAPALDAGDRQRLACACGIAARSSRLSATARSPSRPSSRYDGPAAAAVDAGRLGGLVDRHAAGPVAGADASTETRRSHGHRAAGGGHARRPRRPARSCAAARAATGRRARPRSARSCAVSSTSARQRVADDGSFTATCTSSAPIATQATA